MKRFVQKLPLILLFTVVIVFSSCFNDDLDDNLISSTEINDFVWKGLNLWYFWQQDVPDLDDSMVEPQSDYINYLNSFSSPEDLFNSLQFIEDRFSIIVANYNDLINALDGTSVSNGMEFGLARINGTSELVGFVQYVVPNSNAESQAVERGMLFRTVDGTNLNEDNFESLLFSQNNTYTIGLADLSGNDVILNGTEITLTKQVLTENPILISKVIEVDGIKIGYLMYNGFRSDFDAQLNNVFGDFAAENIDELVIDLRYNPGGSVATTIRLGSMITGQYADNLFLKRRYNDKLNEIFSEESKISNFVSTLGDGTPINSLNLDRLYVLAQQSSASASELLINALSASPYLGNNVIHIGGTTRGKNEFSTLLVDAPDCAYVLTSECDGLININHTYGMLPLIGRNENADGFFEFTAGLPADIDLPEDISNLGILGDENEPLLKRAIEEITGSRSLRNETPNRYFSRYTDSKLFSVLGDIMIDEDISFQ